MLLLVARHEMPFGLLKVIDSMFTQLRMDICIKYIKWLVIEMNLQFNYIQMNLFFFLSQYIRLNELGY